MAQGRQGTSLFLKATLSAAAFFGVGRVIVFEHLFDDAQPVERPAVVRQIDGTHAPLGHAAGDEIVAALERGAGHQARLCGATALWAVARLGSELRAAMWAGLGH